MNALWIQGNTNETEIDAMFVHEGWSAIAPTQVAVS